MASIAAPRFPTPTPAHCTSPNFVASPASPSSLRSAAAFFPPSYRRATLSGFRRPAEPFLCRCQNPSSDAGGTAPRRWDEALQDAVKSAAKRWEDYLRSVRGSLEKVAAGASVEQRDMADPMEEDGGDGEWDWERWKRHFVEVEEHENIVSVLRSQLNDAVYREDYKDAAKLKRAIAAAAANDAVGYAIKNLNNAVKEEHYEDAIFLRDHAGTGLVGWWAGISEDSSDPYGRIICITAEHGKYVARSFNSRQLVNGRSGFPLFEVYFTVGDDGEYKQQAVYLKRKSEFLRDSKKALSPTGVDSTNPISDSEDDTDISVIEDLDFEEGADDSDVSDGLNGAQNTLHDMIPGVKVKVLKVISPGSVDQDLISNIIEQIMDEEDEEDEESEAESASDSEENAEKDGVDDIEIEVVDSEDGIEMELESEEIELGTEDMVLDVTNEHGDLSLKFVVGGIVENLSVDLPRKDLVRVPARLEKKGRSSFSFSLVHDNTQNDLEGKEQKASEKTTKHPNLRSPELIMADLAKVLASKEKIPIKILKDVGEMIKLTLNQDRNNQPLCGTMFFNRIEMTSNSDPLSGLYISAHGMFNTEVLNLRRKFGQWKEDGKNRKNTKLEFYEYVEALKLTGDPSVPAGQVAFRAKVGKQYQLPHKGIIPEEFGVIARYKGQGRLAEPGFRNPRWVDGELVILDGKYIRGGPVIGFVYWAPEYHYLMFFNRLKLPE